MISSFISRIVILLFGTLYPAYASYKAVRTKDVKEYVKWMMYWIVFALFVSVETITDIFFSFWFPFYYELKIVVVLWLLSPATQGSSILYRKCVHPLLSKREQEIDECIARAKQQSYRTVLELGTKGVHYATQVIMQTAIKGGGGLVSQLKKSYSVGDLPSGGRSQSTRAITRPASVPEDDVVDNTAWVPARTLATLPDISDSELDEHAESVAEPVMYASMPPPTMRPPRAARSPKGVYFGEIDGHLRRLPPEDMAFLGVRSSEDITFSSNEHLSHVDSPTRLMRTGSLRAPRPQSQIITRSTGIPTKGVSNANLQDPAATGDKTKKENRKRVRVASTPVKKRRAPPPPTVVAPKSSFRPPSNLVSSSLSSALPVLCLGQWDGRPWSGTVVCNVASTPQGRENDQETYVTNSGCETGHCKLNYGAIKANDDLS